MKLEVKLLKKSNHGQAGDVVSLQDETATLLISLGLAEIAGEPIFEPETEEIVEDDSGNESGEDDITE
mgnify:CR=1 FL=1